MSDKVAEVRMMLQPDQPARWITGMWVDFNSVQRQQKLNDWGELKKYLFATDTTTTTNAALPWKNSTTLPKLTQIRDNLHSNYLSALFPNDNWIEWEAYTQDDAAKEKATIITSYVSNKARMSNLRTEVSKLIYDYIDYGNAFCTVIFEKKINDNKVNGPLPTYIGPKLVRISPEDIVFNPLANSFENTYKIVRSIKTVGEIIKMAQDEPENAFWSKAIEKRQEISRRMVGYTMDDFNKAAQYSVDGFGNLYEYYSSNYVELLEFYGDYYDTEKQELHTNRLMTIMDRTTLARDVPVPTYSGRAPIWHVGWRLRPDNLWAMGPLDNLVGMQYRIDHLENLKADAMDLSVHPPLKVIGEVEEFDWGPGSEIHINGDGQSDVEEVAKNLNAIITADNQIQNIQDLMELFSGAPREAMGVRTPGEKTAFEVQTLDNAAGRIFQEKSTNFEINLLEPALNGFLESAQRNLDVGDTISTMDNDLGVQEFMSITAKDIQANGIIRPVGARHFAQQATELQNLIGIANSPIWAKIIPHTSGIQLSKFVNDITNLDSYGIFRENVAIEEAQQTQALANQAGEDNEVAAATPTPTNTKILPIAPNTGRGHGYGTPNYQAG